MTRCAAGLDRRSVLGVTLMLVAMPTSRAGDALPPDVAAAIREQVGGAAATEGGIALRAPETAENGAFVPVTVSVHSAMAGDDRCLAIHLFATRNPTPGVASYRFGAGIARAEVSVRVRLAEGQMLLAYAEMADGSVRRAVARVAVTTGGCLT
ncbi:thiosulfate oxidation carrier protein SoxY [Phreatobacter sp.]|uniref:thiosulfate oxidation carrier protein SoxY n=1 Tax=Phreatobacter sp. TaxID=1966341 RepID=UPI0025DD44BB|nr:thiosulfate oxidation carrier protein SoxY [Phreatobacter sp.]